ncbi:glycosyltransferase family 2 protein [Pedobacter sp.]|uniref:glycosyltransferase family 2 protein n=1 Tax=Pedobacter sp. TaxID=1411316 RepID=UPI003D7F1974
MKIKDKTTPFLEYLYSLFWKISRFSWKMMPQKASHDMTNHRYSIGITTYANRYETLFKPFLLQLLKIFNDTEIIIAVNGHYHQDLQRAYLDEINSFAKQFKNVKVVSFMEGQGLSKLWNQLILNSTNEKILICNDDLEISPLFRRDLEHVGILTQNIALINQSWSHFLISKSIIRQVGWFDERFPAIGNEDEDFESRLVLMGIPLGMFHFRSIKAVRTIPVSYSYGAEVELVNGKYLKSNKAFFDSKWDTATAPVEGYHYVRILKAWVKLREGMETPQFYNQ